MKRINFVFWSLILFGTNLFAQTIIPKSEFICNIDYARFQYNNTSGYLEIYFGFYPDLLTYVFKDNKFHGGVKLLTRLMDNESKKVLANKKSFFEISEKDTNDVWYHYPFISQNAYVVPFGNLQLKVVAFDSLAPSRRDSISIPIQISPFPSRVGISDIELCKKIAPSHNNKDFFYKNTLEVLPNPSLVFGAKNFPILFNYVELYNLSPGEELTLQKAILDRNGNVVRQKAKSKLFKQKNVLDIDKFTVTSFPSGTYYLRYLVMDSTGKKMAGTSKKFYLYNPHLDRKVKSISSATKVLTELDGLSEDELNREFQYAKYVATDQEIKMFDQIKTEQGKRQFLANFWHKVSSGRQDWRPISRSRYLSRVQAANERFRALGKDGWKTSRGRVFILYGQPDQIERVPSEAGGKPYRVWYYYKIEDGVEFIFVDRSGYGDYELVHSTKRGELQDENWQRLLR